MNTLAERIANGKTKLLGAEEICERIGVSRTTFDRWVRASTVKQNGDSHHLHSALIGTLGASASRSMDYISEMSMTFPPPDIRIGNSPKWELDTLIQWLNNNIKNS